MSRLYGRSYDVYNTSRYLKDSNIPKYHKNKTKTDWDDVVVSPEKIEIYLPDTAIKILENKPIQIVKSPFVVKETSILPRSEDEEATIFFPTYKAIEEYKRELVFFLGTVLSIKSPDELPKNYNIPCEYSDLLALLFEYLYLKETNDLDNFSLKHLNELIYNAKHYVPFYETYYKRINKDKELEFFVNMNEKERKVINEHANKREKSFLKSTLDSLVALSSMDAVLQITDKYSDVETIKNIIEELLENRNNNRQEIINNMGIESYGYKRLKKEIDRSKKNE